MGGSQMGGSQRGGSQSGRGGGGRPATSQGRGGRNGHHLSGVRESADEAHELVVEKLRFNYKDVCEAFMELDSEDCGFVNKKDLLEALLHIYLSHGMTQEDVEDLATKCDLNEDGDITPDEFFKILDHPDDHSARAESVRGGSVRGGSVAGSDAGGTLRMPPQQQPRGFGDQPAAARNGGYNQQKAPPGNAAFANSVDHAVQDFKLTVDRRFTSMRDAFRTFDKGRTSSLNATEFSAALESNGLFLQPDVEEEVRRVFDPDDTGRITYAMFCQVMSARHDFGKNMNRQGRF